MERYLSFEVYVEYEFLVHNVQSTSQMLPFSLDRKTLNFFVSLESSKTTPPVIKSALENTILFYFIASYSTDKFSIDIFFIKEFCSAC